MHDARGVRRVLRTSFARDLTVAMIVKILLLVSVMAFVAHMVTKPQSTAAATADAVAGPTGTGVTPQ